MIHRSDGPKGVTRGVSAQRYSVENDPVPVPRRAPDPVIDPISSMYGIFTYIWLFLMVKYGECR